MPAIYTGQNFELGETLSGTDDDGNLINTQVIGTIRTFPAKDLSVNSLRGNKSFRTGRDVVAVALRNESGLTLYGKRVARLTRTAGYSLLESVDGYADTLLEKQCVIIDEFLATDGVADDDIFWGIIGGPVIVLTGWAGADFSGDIAVGGQLVAATGSTTGVSSAGRVSNVTIVGQTGGTEAFQNAANQIGVALSARTTGETNSDLLINACIKL
jgi:hypothetical protein